jgi:subfamily B ATP-binding cassette protein MsbA
MSLIASFYSPTHGAVRVDGVDLSTAQLESYRSQVGIVLQETFLFNRTIRDNIMVARPDADEADFRRACQLAHVDGFVSELPLRYDTVVGERGAKISGGQRQRIAIARALLADPPVLLLDEATSTLDARSEAVVQESLARLTRGRITFVITHRLSFIREADQILVLDRGRIVERGRHDELLRKHGRYFDLVSAADGVHGNVLVA